MKTRTLFLLNTFILGMLSFSFSCVNHIKDDNESSSGDIEIRISTEILCNQQLTRIVHNDEIDEDVFDSDDALGLYVLAQPGTLDEERYLDNIQLTCASGNIVSKEELFYPEGSKPSDFIAYYPYSETGIKAKSFDLDVFIQPDQRIDANYNASDFMVAKTLDVVPKETPVPLRFSHKLCQINIEIKPDDENDLDKILLDDPVITINDLNTHAIYNFDTDLFSAFDTPQNILPNGQWEKKGGKLVGQKLVVIPQAVTKGGFLTIETGGKSFFCDFPDNLSLKSNSTCTLTIIYNSKKLIGGMNTGIDGWGEDGGNGETTPNGNDINSVDIDNLSFEKSNVYNITSQGEILGEICKEYLLARNIEAQAIVYYPLVGNASDLGKGTILKILGESKDVHGGKISWNTNYNSLTYTPGNAAPISRLYVTPDRSVSFVKPQNPLKISVSELLLTDKRGNEIKNYPVVKIGTQYWMGENLNTTLYTDGTSMQKETSCTDKSIGYFQSSSPVSYFYSAAAVKSGKLVPEGWKVPNKGEWEALETYIQGNTSVLKSGTWKTEGVSADVPLANDLAGFNGDAVGMVVKGSYNNLTTTVAYWISGTTENSLASVGFYLFYQQNTVLWGNNGDNKAYSLRCIRK